MPKLEDRIKIVLDQNKKEIDERISSIFVLGFITGFSFAYTGLFGFSIGLFTGVVITRKFNNEVYNGVEYFTNIINLIKKRINETFH